MPGRLPVRFFLLVVAVVLVVPGMLFGGILLDQFAENERAENLTDLLAATSRLADAVDRELGVLIMAARVLATSERAANGNVMEFASEARAAGSVLGQKVFLAAPDGTRLVTTGQTGERDPGADARAEIQRVAAGRKPLISNLLGQSADQFSVVVLAPVMRNDEVVYVIGISIDPEFFHLLLLKQSLAEGWFATLRGSDGRLVARTINYARTVGTRPPQRVPVAGAVPIAIDTLEGVPALAASAAVPSAGWTITAAVYREVVEAPVRRSELWLALTGVAAMALGMSLAWHLASRISGPLSGLARAGQDLGAGRAVRPVRSGISEVQDLSVALTAAHDQLQERAALLLAKRARLAAIIETVPVGLLIADASGRVVDSNRQLSRMLSCDRLEPEGATLEAVDADDRPVPEHLMPLPRALSGDDPAELNSRFRRADGTLFWAQAVAAPIAGAAGEVTGAVLALLDIDEAVRARQQKERWADQLEVEVKARTSELERANHLLLDEMSARGRVEDQLRQSQKMEAVGRLTGGIAHDFNNLLTVIVGSLELLRRRVTEPRLVRLVESAADGASRAAELISRLLAFSRRQPLLPQLLDVNQLVVDMSTLLRRSLGETIAIETALADDLWQAMADPNQLESALVNLAVNARDAILETSPGGGRLRIETSQVTIERGSGGSGSELQPGDYVVIATIDSGCGMAPETIAQAFEPFFTTKPRGKGTGLGLSQVHGFAVQSGGYVAIESALGRGTAVKLYVPRARENVAAGTDVEKPTAPPCSRPGLVILVVEDEPAVRMFTAEALRLLDYTVLEAGGGAEALAVLAAHPEIALMLTDVVMPGMNGRELAREVERRRPDLPILLASGYNRALEEPEDTQWQLLPKPFTVTALASAIENVLRMHRDRVANRDAPALDDLRMDA